MSNDHRYVASVVASYWFISISMVYLNKVLMSSKSVSIEAPLFITWFQCVVTAAICWAAGELALRFKKAEYEAVAKEEGDDEAAAAKPSFWSQFPKADYRWSVARKVYPLSLIFVGMITFNNLCLMWVEVSFYNVARSLTIVFNVILSQYILNSYTSPKTMACLAIVIFGFFMGSKGELNFSLYGTLSGVLSSLFVSLNSIFTKKVLPAVDNDHWKLTFYNNVNACVLFIPMMMVYEGPVLVKAFGDQFLSLLFWSAMLVAGVFGFMIGTGAQYPNLDIGGRVLTLLLLTLASYRQALLRSYKSKPRALSRTTSAARPRPACSRCWPFTCGGTRRPCWGWFRSLSCWAGRSCTRSSRWTRTRSPRRPRPRRTSKCRNRCGVTESPPQKCALIVE
jgi:solute carrier family 35 (GDP-fucose transporter), member C1